MSATINQIDTISLVTGGNRGIGRKAFELYDEPVAGTLLTRDVSGTCLHSREAPRSEEG
jgi:hypothetical protein